MDLSPTAPRARRAAAAAAVLALPLAACGASAPELLDMEGECMGTTWSARVRADPARGDALRSLVQAELDLVDTHLSTWKEASDLSRLARAEVGERVPVAAVTLDVLDLADELVEETDRAFDPTIGPLVDLWGFRSTELEGLPAPETAEIEAARERLGWDAIHWERTGDGAGVAWRSRADVEVDLSALAKGHAVDLAAAALRSAGASDFLLEVGGEMVLSGERPGGEPWRTGIVDPRPVQTRDPDPPLPIAPSPPFGVVRVTDLAVATSGDYRNVRRLADGRTVAHAIDPRTGRPVEHALASVTVFGASCGRADALATAALVLGPDEGLALLEGLDGVEGIALVRKGDGDDSLRIRSTTGAPELTRIEG